jgi:micrococcal nuclease
MKIKMKMKIFKRLVLPFFVLSPFTVAGANSKGSEHRQTAQVPSQVLVETCESKKAQPVSVMRCYDGDTCTLSDKTKIRLAGIDAPEKKGTMGGKGQSGSEIAAESLRERLVGKKGVTMISHDTDRYGRVVGEFCLDGKSVNVEMVREGLALKFRGKVRTKTIDTVSLENAELEAKNQGKGLWAMPQNIEDPGSYRKKLREAQMNYNNSDPQP